MAKRFRQEGIADLWFKSTRPYFFPNRTPLLIKTMVVDLRKVTSLGAVQISRIVNDCL
jgi:hypothetical protein